MAEQLSTSINRPWAIKTIAIGMLFFLFGLWGLFDALVAYPNRGEKFALKAEQLYLQASDETGRLLRAGMDDPAARRSELQDKRSLEGELNAREGAQLQWLDALSRIGQLDADRTAIPRARGSDPIEAALTDEGNTPASTGDRIEGAASRLRDLTTYWSTREAPKPLSSYDLPSQWVIFAVGILVAGYNLLLIARVGMTHFRYDPSTKTLTLPGGTSIAPADLEDVDKRKWEKYIVFLKIDSGHSALAGQEVKVDLYRHAPLEEWVLEMEAERFPERAAEAEAAEAEETGDAASETDPNTDPESRAD